MNKILISGASKGLGKSLAEYYAKCNFEVVTFARTDIDTSNFTNWKHYANVDVSNVSSLDILKPELKNCNYLINNVGMAYDGILATQGLESIETMITINLTSVIYLTKLWVRERMKVKQPGSCIMISSIISERGFSGLSVYSATKGALNSLVQSLAREMGPYNIRFNAILPGYFESELSKSLSQGKKQQIINRTPLNRLAVIDDIIPAIDFMLSANAKFITGSCLKIDGGLTV